MGQLKYSAVPMKEVPHPPARAVTSSIQKIYLDLVSLGTSSEEKAMLISCRDQKHLSSVRNKLRKYVDAQAGSFILCSSRSEDYTKLYVWLSAPAGRVAK